jgi:TetR/AcrR family tetracycline transcriptional repressor
MARAPGRPKEPALSRRVAVAAALAIIDRDGLAALNIRSLAAALEVNSASLYHHFENKDEILLGVARSVLRDVTVHDGPGEPWQTQMVTTMRTLRRALLAHPNAIPLILELHPRSFAPEPYDKIIEVFERNGVPPDFALTVLDATEGLTFGWALHFAYAASVEAGPAANGRGQRLARMYQHSRLDDEARFDLACHALIDGLTAAIGLSAPTTSSVSGETPTGSHSGTRPAAASVSSRGSE